MATARTKTIHYAWNTNTTEIASFLKKLFIYDASGTSYADETADANNTTATDITFLADADDIWYIGCDNIFNFLRVDISTNGTIGTGTNVWEYWDGDSWETLTMNLLLYSLNATRDSEYNWNPPDDWATCAVNGTTCYWIRNRIITAYTLAPVGLSLHVGGAASFASNEADEQDTRIKTVMIPLGSPTGALSTDMTEIGTNQVPDLDDLLPEASKAYRDIYFVIQGANFSTVATDYTLSVQLDSESPVAFGAMDNGGNSSTFDRYVWSRTDLTTSDAHAFKAKTSTSDVGYISLAVYMVVTYEYGETASSSFMNSIQFGLEHSSDYLPNSVDIKDTLDAEIYIEEPTTITVKQSGVMLNSRSVTSAGSVSIKESSAVSYTTYGAFNASLWCGQDSFIHRIDDSLSLSRGKNTIAVNIYGDTLLKWMGQQTVCFLNYTSGKASGGSNTHNHTTYWMMSDYWGNDQDPSISSFAPDIAETNYWMNNCTISVKAKTALASFAVAVYTGLNAGEFKGAGWYEVLTAMTFGTSEAGQYETSVNVTKHFERYPSSPRDRIDLGTARSWRISTPEAATCASAEMLVTYHAITFTLSGTASGYAGDGSGITVFFHRTDTHERMVEATTSAGGGYSATWYDDTIDLYGHAREDATHVGRSDNDTAA